MVLAGSVPSAEAAGVPVCVCVGYGTTPGIITTSVRDLQNSRIIPVVKYARTHVEVTWSKYRQVWSKTEHKQIHLQQFDDNSKRLYRGLGDFMCGLPCNQFSTLQYTIADTL